MRNPGSNSYEIPTSAQGGFKRLDTRINSSNQFANVYSLQRLRRNHNILWARRTRKVICSAYNGTALYSTLSALGPRTGYVIMAVPITITKGVVSVCVEVHGYASAAGAALYPIVHANDQIPVIDENDVIDVGVAPIALYSSTITVPERVRTEGRGRFTMYYEGGMTGADVKGPNNVLDAGSNWIVTAGALDTGSALYFPTNLSIIPRIILEEYTVTGGVKTVVRGDFNILPDPGTPDTAASRSMISVNPRNVCLYENYRSSMFTGAP